MAFVTYLAGDNFSARAISNVPKAFVPANYPAPAVGDLLVPDTTGASLPTYNNAVRKCLTGEVPLYLVESVNSANGTLSVWVLGRVISLVFQYGTLPVVNVSQIQMGDQVAHPPAIKIGGTVRSTIQPVPTPNGVGLVVAVDQPSTGLCVVEFGSAL